MQTMIDPTVLALCVASGALVLAFGVAGALWRRGRNAETAMADLVERLAVEFWAGQKLDAEAEKAIGWWSEGTRANLRRLLAAGEASGSFRSRLETNPTLRAALDEVRALKVTVRPERPIVDFPVDETAVQVERRVSGMAESAAVGCPRGAPDGQTPPERAVSAADRTIRTLKGLKGLTAYVIGVGGDVSVGTVTDFRFRYGTSDGKRTAPEVRICDFAGTKRPPDLTGGGVWREITKVCWTQQEVEDDVAGRTRGIIADVRAVFSAKREKEDTETQKEGKR
jgi:hypothetical protein